VGIFFGGKKTRKSGSFRFSIFQINAKFKASFLNMNLANLGDLMGELMRCRRRKCRERASLFVFESATTR
jgi:hypothetical protein